MRNEQHNHIERVEGWGLFLSGFGGIVLSLLGASLSYYVSRPRQTFDLAVPHSLIYLFSGIVLFGIVLVAIASLMQRKQRNVIVLTQHLAEIYSSALKKSALNPQLESSTPHE